MMYGATVRGKTPVWEGLEDAQRTTVGWSWEASPSEVTNVIVHGSDSMTERKTVKLTDLGIRLVREGGNHGRA